MRIGFSWENDPFSGSSTLSWLRNIFLVQRIETIRSIPSTIEGLWPSCGGVVIEL